MAMNPTMEEIIKNAENNIRQAVIDYGKHTSKMDVLNDFSDEIGRASCRERVSFGV